MDDDGPKPDSSDLVIDQFIEIVTDFGPESEEAFWFMERHNSDAYVSDALEVIKQLKIQMQEERIGV